jgi:hypothetical protein
MEFRRSGQRGDRRRRVMLDERLGSSEAVELTVTARADQDKTTEHSLAVRTYHEAAATDWQRRVTDLIPTRWGTLLLLFLVGVAAIAGIEVLYGQSETWGTKFGEANVAALDPTRPASLGGWFSSFVMVVCSMTALLVYSIRRHKEDDYRGRYRIWIWAAMVWLFGSMAAAAPIHRLVAAAVAHGTGSQLVGNPALFSTAFYAMIISTVAVPVVVDLRQNRLALLTILAAGACYLTAAAIDLQLLLPLAGPLQTICLSAARMGSHLLLLTSLLVFARHVFLDAQGKIAARPAKQRLEKPAKKPRRRTQPKLKVVSDDLGDTVSEPAKPVAKRRKTRAGSDRKTASTTSTAATTSRRRIKSTSLRSSTSSSSPATFDPDAAEPRTVKVPSIRRKKSAEPQDEFDEEIARLETIEPHLLTKSQRRRLRKLQRRHERKAA